MKKNDNTPVSGKPIPANDRVDSGELTNPKLPQVKAGILDYKTALNADMQVDVPLYKSIKAGDSIIVSLTYTDVYGASRTSEPYYVSQEDIDAGNDIRITLPFNIIEDGPYSVTYAVTQDGSMTPCPSAVGFTLKNSPGSQWVTVTNLSLSSKSGESAVSIYSNGLNLAQVNVYFTPQNPGNNTMYRLAQTLRMQSESHQKGIEKIVTLLDYKSVYPSPKILPCVPTPTPENPPPSPPENIDDAWAFCIAPNKFVKSPEAGNGINVRDDVSTALVTLYVLCNYPDGGEGTLDVGVRITPANGNAVYDISNSPNQIHSELLIKTQTPPSIAKLINRNDVTLTVRHMPHSGELADSGSDYYKDQPVGNYWRQYNCYIQLSRSTGKKIVAMKCNAPKNDKNNLNMFADYINLGYRTRAYIWDFGQRTAQIMLWNNYSQSIDVISSDMDNAICISYVTMLNFDHGSYYNSFPSSGVVGTFYDQDGNAYGFTPNYDLPTDLPEFKDIKALRNYQDSPSTVEKVFRLGTTTPSIPGFVGAKSGYTLRNVYFDKFMFPDSHSVSSKYSYQHYCLVGHRGEGARMFWQWQFIGYNTNMTGYFVNYEYQWLTNGSGRGKDGSIASLTSDPGYNAGDIFSLRPVWDSSSFYIYGQTGGWLRPGWSADSMGDQKVWAFNNCDSTDLFTWQIRDSCY
ncbi:hypothetical protein [Enterobacter kobei]|uniref:hypothetical protein n=1 Tax=Enterobacter kobei TaxID=208224 RepID=UPI003CF2813E